MLWKIRQITSEGGRYDNVSFVFNSSNFDRSRNLFRSKVGFTLNDNKHFKPKKGTLVLCQAIKKLKSYILYHIARSLYRFEYI